MKKPRSYALSDRITVGRAIVYMIVTLVGIVMLYPMWYVLCASLSDNLALTNAGLILLPKQFNLDSYRYVLGTRDLLNIYGNTLYVLVFGIGISMVLSILAAYALAHKPRGYHIANLLFLVPMLFSAGTIPSYVNMKSLGLLNNLWALILSSAISSYNVFILRNFFSSLPQSVEEAAVIDGAGTFTILFRIVLPLSLAGIATVGLFYAVTYWNTYFNALLYCNRRENWVLQIFLKETLITSQPDILGSSADTVAGMKTSSRTVQMAVVIVSVVPILIVYPFIQRYFVKGVMVGAVKG